jgi:hypothetical protein
MSNEPVCDIQVYASWCNDGTADLRIDCRTHDVDVYSTPYTTSLSWPVIVNLVNKHLESQ